jgi:hypothetical protein
MNPFEKAFEEFKKLPTWQKVGVVGAIASIIALVAFFGKKQTATSGLSNTGTTSSIPGFSGSSGSGTGLTPVVSTTGSNGDPGISTWIPQTPQLPNTPVLGPPATSAVFSSGTPAEGAVAKPVDVTPYQAILPQPAEVGATKSSETISPWPSVSVVAPRAFATPTVAQATRNNTGIIGTTATIQPISAQAAAVIANKQTKAGV